MWAVVYVVTFAQTYKVHAKAALQMGGAFAPPLPPLDPPLNRGEFLPSATTSVATPGNTPRQICWWPVKIGPTIVLDNFSTHSPSAVLDSATYSAVNEGGWSTANADFFPVRPAMINSPLLVVWYVWKFTLLFMNLPTPRMLWPQLNVDN